MRQTQTCESGTRLDGGIDTAESAITRKVSSLQFDLEYWKFCKLDTTSVSTDSPAPLKLAEHAILSKTESLTRQIPSSQLQGRPEARRDEPEDPFWAKECRQATLLSNAEAANLQIALTQDYANNKGSVSRS